VGGIWRARTSSTVGSQEPSPTLPSLRSITLKPRTAHQKAASRSGSWQSTTNAVTGRELIRHLIATELSGRTRLTGEWQRAIEEAVGRERGGTA